MYFDRLTLLFVMSGYFLSPAILQWLNDQGPAAWYRPFIAWGILIILIYWVIQGRNTHGR